MPRTKAKVLKTTRTEGEVLAAILDAVDVLGIELDRQNTGGAYLPGKGGKEQLVRYGKRGNSDLTGMIVHGPNKGKKLDVEVKAEGFDPARTSGEARERFDRQLARLQRTNDQGGIAFWCDDAVTFVTIMRHVLDGARVVEPGYGRPEVIYPEPKGIDDGKS